MKLTIIQISHDTGKYRRSFSYRFYVDGKQVTYKNYLNISTSIISARKQLRSGERTILKSGNIRYTSIFWD